MLKAEVNLYIYAVMPDGLTIQTGRLLSRNLRSPDNREGFFQYSPEYLRHSSAYAIDPVHLPLGNEIVKAPNNETGIHDVFNDSLPDAWGRHLLARKGGIEQERYTPAHLLSVLKGEGLGRFMFSKVEKTPKLTDPSIPFDRIAAAMDEAAKLEASLDTETTELRHLLACGTSAGGARPKVITKKDGEGWIAKFASRNDPHPSIFVALEEAGLTLAKMAGLDVPEFNRAEIGQRDILLVKRFDVTDQGRNAIVSFKTLTGAEDPFVISYYRLAGILRRYTGNPRRDVDNLYRQMILNILLVNTDDHLQNFAVLHTAEGWRLSPAYDIVPNLYQPAHILRVNGKHEDLDRRDIIEEGKKFGFTASHAKELLGDTCEKVARWQEVFDGTGVPHEHSQRLRERIHHRFRTVCKCKA